MCGYTPDNGMTNFSIYLSGFGRGLNKRYTVASGQLLCLPHLHSAGTQVTLVPNQHHGNIFTVLYPVNLLSETYVTIVCLDGKTKKLQKISATFSFLSS